MMLALALSACGGLTLETDFGPAQQVTLVETWPAHDTIDVPTDTRLVLWWQGIGGPMPIDLRLTDLDEDYVILEESGVLPDEANIGFIDLAAALEPGHVYALAWRTADQPFPTERPEVPGDGFASFGYAAFTAGADPARSAYNAVNILAVDPLTTRSRGTSTLLANAVIDDATLSNGTYWEVRDTEDRLFHAGVAGVRLMRASHSMVTEERPDNELCLSSRSFSAAGTPGAESNTTCSLVDGPTACHSAAAPASWWWLAALPIVLGIRRRKPTFSSSVP